MIHSLFVINAAGFENYLTNHNKLLVFDSKNDFFSDILLEKHWKSVIHRSICDYFFEAQKKVTNFPLQNHFCVFILIFGIWFKNIDRLGILKMSVR